jgi:hypothetical protein
MKKKLSGKMVRVYRNLHKKCFSVKCMKTGLVIAHVDTITLENATFPVSKAGRKRVLKEKRKNVHAFVQGVVTNILVFSNRKICYNPYKRGHFFHCSNGREIKKATAVTIGLQGLYAS